MNRNKNTERDKLYLAALLHDIGKFYQRSDSGSTANSSMLDSHIKNLEQVICPANPAKIRTHKHVLWTAQFFEDHQSVFNNLIERAGWKALDDRDSLMFLASGHHLKKDQLSELGKIIQEADHLSSGMDRSSLEALKDDQDASAWNAFKQKRMTCVLEGVMVDSKTMNYHQPVDKLSIARDFFPRKQFDSTPDYASLWDDFVSEMKFIQADNSYSFSESFLNILHKFTCTIPSSTIHFPDVSLFDHLKTTAALAVCLYDWQNGTKAGDDPFRLIGGDFSGIQSYIYNIISENAAKNLKGRSFYLKLLSDSVVGFILKELNLYQANVIYNSGGSFYLLAPNTIETEQALTRVIDTLEEKIFDSHGATLYVAIASLPMSVDALMGRKNQSISVCWAELFELRDQKKRKRYTNRLLNDYDFFFTAGESGGNSPRDAITGDEITTEMRSRKLKKSGAEVSELTWKQITLGKKLKEADYWVVSDGALDYWPDQDSINPANIGIHYYFLSEADIKQKREALKASADKVRIISVNGNSRGECDFLNTTIMGTNNSFGFDFFGGNNFPADEDGLPKSFDELCGNEGYKRLGVLRMDVDNLGLIFKSGIPHHRVTLSRYAALSRSFDWFFKGYLNTLWREKYSQSTYIVYSGGDDLFLVGKWNEMIAFAEEINAAFKQYTCENPQLTISGGIVVVAPKYPIKRSAEESAAAESLAKNYAYDSRGKNAIALLGMALGWEREYLAVKALKDELVQLMASGKLHKAFISKLYMHYSQAKFEQEALVSPRTYWMLAYDLGRMKEREKRNPRVLSLIENCQLDILGNRSQLNGVPLESNYHRFKLWNIAARWAELEYRTK